MTEILPSVDLPEFFDYDNYPDLIDNFFSGQVRIHDIQGTDLISPFVGRTVNDVEGIVTAIASNGYYLQDPNPDNNSATSEGIFVFTGFNSPFTVSIGDSVRLSGTVTEFQPGGSGTNNLTVTQITSTRNAPTVLSTGNAIPQATIIGAGGLTPPTEIISPEGILFYESLEGMRVTVQDAGVVSPNTGRNIWAVSNQGTSATGINSRDGITIAPGDFNPERIQFNNSLLSVFNPVVNVGDLLGDVTGIVNYDDRGNYQVLLTQPLTSTPGGLQPEVTNLIGTAERLTIASYNVENLNPVDTDAQQRFDGLASHVINNLKTPDIIALQEIQDNNGPINDSVVAADLTYQGLIDAIANAGGPTYGFLNIDPSSPNLNGGQAGANIRVGYIYNPERVSFVEGSLTQSLDPAFNGSRPPLVATFVFNGQEVTTINNHFTSRGGSNSLFGDIQPPNIGGQDRRNAQAQAVNDILATNANANIVVLGDFNGFAFEEFAQILKGGDTPELTNLTDTLPAEERYTFNFQGNSQAIDHLLVTNRLANDAQYDIVHVNVDFSNQEADHEPIIASLFLPTGASSFSGLLPTGPSPFAGDRIHDIQGTGLRSSLVGQTVNQVAGIVTAIASNGFYLQDPNPDNNLATSEGIFVFTSSTPTVSVGDSVLVSGAVSEFQPGGSTSNNLTITRINADIITNASDTDSDINVSVLSSGNPLPTATIIGAGGLTPPTQVIASADFPEIPLDSGIGFYESLEGMRVTVQGATSVSPTSNFSNNSEIWVVSNQGADATGINSRGGIGIAPNDFNPERIQIDDGLLRFTSGNTATAPQVNVGDSLGDVTGVVSYAFGNYEVLATEPVNATSGGLQREVTNLIGTADKLTIASYNVENLNPTAGARFDVLAGQIINNLKAPDIIGLQEIQDNSGPINDGVVAADQTYQGLIDAIAAAGGPTYNFLNIDPINNRDGGAPGSNIRVGYFYNPNRVSFVADSLRRITDPTATPDNDAAFTASRKPLVATFEFNGQDVTVINNHLTSRGGRGTPLFGDTQPPVIGGDTERTAQATVLNGDINQILATNPNAKIVVLGDLNGFDFEQYQQILSGGVLTNLSQTLDIRDRATFNFQGNSQALDHVLVTNNLANNAKYDIVHVNVDFADQPADHEPLVASFDLPTQPFTLQILQTSDQEAGIPAFRDILGFSAVLNALDGQYDNTLKLTTGDVYISSPFFNASRDIYDNATTGNPQADQGGIADILINNELGWDVASVGNHEFSGGSGSFLNLLAPNPNWVNGQNGGVGIGAGGYPGAAFPYLANNLDYSNATLPNGLTVVANGGSPLPNTLTGSVIKDYNGEKVGIIGIVTPYLKSIADTGLIEVTTKDANGNVITGTTSVDVQVDSIIANITPEVQNLINAGINKIILLTHLQESSIEIALAQKMAALGLGVDLLLGGGSHQLQSSFITSPPLRQDETQQNNGQLLQPFPQVYGEGDNKVIFVNSAANYRYLNQLVVTFDYKGVVSSIGDDSGPYATDIAGVDRLYDESITTLDQVKTKADQDIVNIVDGVQSYVNQQDGTIFGQTNVFLNGVRGDVRTQETNLGNLTADAQDFYAEAYLNEHNLLPGFNKIDISFTNGGSIRDHIGQFQVEQLNTFNLAALPPQSNPEVGKEEGDVSQLDIANSLRFDGDLVVGTVNATGFLQLAEHMISSVETGNGRFGQIGGFNFSYDPNAPTGQRIRSLALADETGKSIQTIVENGELLVASNTTFSVVTQAFLANGGDSYPVVLQNVVNLTDYAEPDSLGNANLRSGRIQDAFAEYLSDSYNNNNEQQPFAQADTLQSEDKRIQSLGFRQDTVLDGITALPTTVNGTPGDDTFNAALRDGKQFVGNNQILNTGSGNDTVDVRFAVGGNNIRTAAGNDTVYAGTNNRIDTGAGDDLLFLGSAGGNNIVTGGAGKDNFWITEKDALLLANPNIIADYKANQGDLIGFFDTTLSFGSRGTDWDYRQAGANTIIEAFGQDVAILNGINASTLTQANFVFA